MHSLGNRSLPSGSCSWLLFVPLCFCCSPRDHVLITFYYSSKLFNAVNILLYNSHYAFPCTFPTCEVERSHLNFVNRLALLQTLAPHRDVPLVVGQTPAFLAQTLRLEAGERPVVRDAHTLPRHGSLPGGGGSGAGGLRRLLVGLGGFTASRESKGDQGRPGSQPLLSFSSVGITCLIQFPR